MARQRALRPLGRRRGRVRKHRAGRIAGLPDGPRPEVGGHRRLQWRWPSRRDHREPYVQQRVGPARPRRRRAGRNRPTSPSWRRRSASLPRTSTATVSATSSSSALTAPISSADSRPATCRWRRTSSSARARPGSRRATSTRTGGRTWRSLNPTATAAGASGSSWAPARPASWHRCRTT